MHCSAVVDWDDNRAGETTMQCRGAIRFARAMVVLSSHRWTKMLVRRQARAFEIVVGVAQGNIRTTGLQQKNYRRRHSDTTVHFSESTHGGVSAQGKRADEGSGNL